MPVTREDAIAELQRRRASMNPEQQQAVDELLRRAQTQPQQQQPAVQPQEQPGELSRIGQGAWQEVNPLTIIQGLAHAVMNPRETAAGVIDGHKRLFASAQEAYSKGDYNLAVRHGIASLIPLLGPGMANVTDEMADGDYAHGLGRAIGFSALLAADPSKLKGRRVGLPGFRNKNAVENAAYEYLAGEGVQVPAGTRTGNIALRGAQQLSGRTIGGSRVAQRNEAANAAALRDLSERLANEVHPSPVTAEQAGQSVRSTVGQNTAEAYSSLLDNGSALADRVHPGTFTPEQAGARVRSGVQSSADATEAAIRKRADELAKQVHPDAVVPEQAGGALRGESEAKAVQLGAQADEAYMPFHKTARSEAFAGEVQVGTDARGMPVTEIMEMPVYIGNLQKRLAPLVQEWNMLVEPARRNTSRGYTAMQSIIQWGKPYMPAELAEKALGGLKDLVRTGKYESKGGSEFAKAMHDGNQGIASLAVAELQQAIDAKAASAGEDVIAGLREGRRLTAEKFDVADSVAKLRPEPVQAYGQMVYPNDSGIEFARTMAGHAPQSVPQIARSLFDSVLNEASWESAANKWKSIGNSTKELLYPDAAVRQSIDGIVADGKSFADAQLKLKSEPVKFYEGLVAKRDSNIEFTRQVASAAPAEMPKAAKAFVDTLIDEARSGPEGWRKAYRKWQETGEETKQLLYANPDVRTGLEFFFEAGANLADSKLARELATEPVAIYKRLTTTKDAEIEFLRQIRKEAPGDVPKVARALFQGLVDTATAEGGWTRSQGVLGKWQAIGNETKNLLFGPQITERIDKLFLGTKKMAEQVNTSGTTPTLVTLAEGGMWLNALGDAAAGNLLPAAKATGVSLGGYALARLLFSPRGTELLMKGMTMPANHAAAAMTAAQIARIIDDGAQSKKK